MVVAGARDDALRLQALLRELLGHDAIAVRPHGQHLVIDTLFEDGSSTVARLTRQGRREYGAAFRSHTGRWDPLPLAGDMQHVAEGVVALLGVYLTPL